MALKLALSYPSPNPNTGHGLVVHVSWVACPDSRDWVGHGDCGWIAVVGPVLGGLCHKERLG